MRDKFVIEKTPIKTYLLDNVTGGEPYRKTAVSACFDNGFIKIEFFAEDDAVISKGEFYNDLLWKGDVVEVFITLGNELRYLEIEVNPDGYQYAKIVDNDGTGEFTLSDIPYAPFNSVVSVSDEGYSAEISIPLDGLYRLGFQKDNAKINLYRQDLMADGSMGLYALSPTLCGTFHKTEAFLPFEIKEDLQ